MDESLSDLINDKGVCRTSPATPGLLISYAQVHSPPIHSSLLREIMTLTFKFDISLGSRGQKNIKVLPHVPQDVRKVSSTLDHPYHLLSGRLEHKNGVTPEAQLKIRVNCAWETN